MVEALLVGEADVTGGLPKGGLSPARDGVGFADEFNASNLPRSDIHEEASVKTEFRVSVKSADARKHFQFETSVAPLEASNP